MNLDWQPFFDAVEEGMTVPERIRAAASVARERFETERFEEFVARHLSDLDEVTHDFFGTESARDAVRQKVEAMFPSHEVERFTELFWQRIQRWREEESSAALSGG
jgi:uncharacterized protein (UPF0147 family)